MNKRLSATAVIVALTATSILTIGVAVKRNRSIKAVLPDSVTAQIATTVPRSKQRGRAGAAHTILLFLDYADPQSTPTYRTIDSVIVQRPDNFRLVVLSYPKEHIFDHAYTRALIAECGALRGQFFETVHDLLTDLASTGNASRAVAGGWYADSIALRQCKASERARSAISMDLELASLARVSASPAIFLDGVRMPSQPADSLIAALRRGIP